MPHTVSVFEGLLRLPVWLGLGRDEIVSVVHAVADLLE